MIAAADFDAYLARIGWDGPAPALDRGSLERLARLHTATIPFENLDPLLGRAPDLAPEALVAKLVHGGRGGYCFEQNGLLRLVLEAIGFRTTGLAARVLWNQPEDAVTPRSHMLLRVELAEGPVLIDVGFGGAALTGVLDLVSGVGQATPHEPFRLIEVGGEWRQQIRVQGEWRTTYRFDLTPQLPIDYEAANWWCATSPASHFTQMPVAARALPGRRLALRGRDYAVHDLAGGTERRTLADPAEICDILANDFAIRLPDRAALAARLEGLG